jgi:rare lipoprotein A
MMKKYFVIALIAISAFFAAAPHGALARASSQDHEPTLPKDASSWVGESGAASYYGKGYHGRLSANGARYDQMGLTAAHPWLPFGTKVKVTLAGTTRSVVVTITDRLYYGRRIVDLSVAAASQLGMISRGVAAVTLLPV